MDEIKEPIVSVDDPRFQTAFQQLLELAKHRPFGGYKVLYADPAWLYGGYSLKGAKKGALRHYPCMSTELLCLLPVESLMAKDSVLFLWACWPNIFDAEKVIKAWGFKYSGLAWEWLKFNPNTGKYSFGLGYGTRKNVEPCLLARRGDPKCQDKSVRDFILPEHDLPQDTIMSPKREHSRKPAEARARIEKMFPEPRLEMFARTEREGWAVWGNETDKFLEDVA